MLRSLTRESTEPRPSDSPDIPVSPIEAFTAQHGSPMSSS